MANLVYDGLLSVGVFTVLMGALFLAGTALEADPTPGAVRLTIGVVAIISVVVGFNA